MRSPWLVALLVVVACKSEKPRESAFVQEAKRCGTRGAEMECARPIIRVANLAASQHYYRDALGFKIDWEHGEPPTFGSVSRGDFVLFMCEACQSAPGMWSMTFMKSVDPYYEELKKREAIIKQPPTDMPWGLREMHVADLDGNVIRFASQAH